MMALDNLPGVAQVAIQGARYAARGISNRLDERASQQPFKYADKGSMATSSRFSAVVSIGRIHITGFVAWLMWLALHLVYLTGFKNGVSALGHWLLSFIGRVRQERVVTENQIYARRAMNRIEGGAATLASSPDD
jgi:NADH dehydrogenase